VRNRISDDADHPAAKLDVFAPKNASGAPVRVYFDGGGWLRGAKEGAAFAAPLSIPHITIAQIFCIRSPILQTYNKS